MTSFKAWPQVKPKLVKICLSASFSLENEVNKNICTGKYKLLISTGRLWCFEITIFKNSFMAIIIQAFYLDQGQCTTKI